MENFPNLIVPFKRPVYERVVKEFSRLAGNWFGPSFRGMRSMNPE